MPGNTPTYNLPYPVATDLVINGPATIQALAEDVENTITSVLGTTVPTSRQVIAGTGLSGGGSLSTNVTLNASFGTTAGTIAQGNDARILGAVQNTRQITVGSGLQGGGDLSTDVNIAANFGTTGGTIAEGNDSRIVNAVQPTRQVIAGSGLQGGGNLATDVLLNVDVVSLANDVQFSDRYKPINEPIWIPASEMNFDTGTRVIVNDATDAIEMAESVDSYALGMAQIPPQWLEAEIVVAWANANTGAGDVQWDFFANSTGPASNISSLPSLTPALIVAAGSQYILQFDTGPSISVGDFLRFRVQRSGTSGSDTLNNEVYLVGVLLNRSL